MADPTSCYKVGTETDCLVDILDILNLVKVRQTLLLESRGSKSFVAQRLAQSAYSLYIRSTSRRRKAKTAEVVDSVENSNIVSRPGIG